MGHRIFACGHPPTGWRHCPVCGSTDLVEDCTCGSGGHPRYCATHPDEYAKHIAELEADALADGPSLGTSRICGCVSEYEECLCAGYCPDNCHGLRGEDREAIEAWRERGRGDG